MSNIKTNKVLCTILELYQIHKFHRTNVIPNSTAINKSCSERKNLFLWFQKYNAVVWPCSVCIILCFNLHRLKPITFKKKIHPLKDVKHHSGSFFFWKLNCTTSSFLGGQHDFWLLTVALRLRRRRKNALFQSVTFAMNRRNQQIFDSEENCV
jgi:hypothetical protein